MNKEINIEDVFKKWDEEEKTNNYKEITIEKIFNDEVSEEEVEEILELIKELKELKELT